MWFGQNVLRMSWKERFVQFLWKARCFPFLKRNLGRCDDFENFDGQNCDLAKTCCACPKKSVLYNFDGKRTVFPILARISGQCEDFENFHAQKCDLAKTCCAWAEKRVFYNFHGKYIVFPFWREFKASVTILRALTLKNVIWPKRAAHDLKWAFRAIFKKSVLFSCFATIWGQCDDFENFDAQKCDLAKTCSAWPEKSVLYNFHGKRTGFLF